MPDGRHIGPCCRCKSEMWLPTSLYESAKRSEKIIFYCPYGHEQIFSASESEETKLRRERDRLLQRLAQVDDWANEQRRLREAAERQAASYKAQATKARQRGSAGICQCCNRQFQNVVKHMASKHPEFKAKEAA